MKNFFNKNDVGLARMRKDKMLPDVIAEYMHDVYSFAREEYVNYLTQKYPDLVAGESFLGATTTNSMEGGNWRIKYELRVPYEVAESIFARSI
ncbi:MAG: hypothetical protein JRN52_02110 [Nitrososphaerota archaeon]|nr:hypothetical protein [Nitrososphaerota archaeon]